MEVLRKDTIFVCNIDLKQFDSKPSGDDVRHGMKTRLAKNMVAVSCTELEQAICRGQSWTPCALTGTTAASFKSSELCAADIDNTDEKHKPLPPELRMTPEAAAALMEQHGIHPYFMYGSFSDTPEHRRFRPVIRLDRIVTDPVVMAEANRKFQGLFGQNTDTSVSNLDRLYYGSRPDSIILSCTDMITPLESVLALPDPKPPKPKNTTQAAPRQSNYDSQHTGSFDLRPLLDYIPASECSRDQWVRVGMALKTEGYDFSVWDEWSRYDSRYNERDCIKQWSSFRGSGVTGATVTHLAKQYGWEPPQRGFDWDDEIDFDTRITAGWQRQKRWWQQK